MIEMYKGICIEIIICFEHYANTFGNFIFNICDIDVILSSIITPMYFISLVTVNIEPPITRVEE